MLEIGRFLECSGGSRQFFSFTTIPIHRVGSMVKADPFKSASIQPSGPRQVWCAKRAREPANLGSFLCQVMSRARVSSGLPHGCTVIPHEKKRYSFLSASTQQTSWFFIETSSFVFQRRLVRRSGLRRPYRTVAFSVFSRVQSCARRSIHWEGKGKPSCDV